MVKSGVSDAPMMHTSYVNYKEVLSDMNETFKRVIYVVATLRCSL